MDPELEEGNIEYKLKLLDISPGRIERLATQMRYRCDEGGGECIYNLGVEDDGTMTGLTQEDYDVTLRCILGAAHKNNYTVTKLTKSPADGDRYVYEVLLRENNDNSYIDIKVAIAGNVDAGKSTLLSVLTQGKKDDGRGAARLAVFNFPHEVTSGRTSSIGHQILGYNTLGEVMNHQGMRSLAWPDIVRRSSKVVSFYDLAGHEKYLKTTIFGLSSSRPDICIIMVSANKGIMRMTKEHIFLCKTLNIPFCVVVTKIDMVRECSNVMEDTMHSIQTILKRPGIRRMPLKVKNDDDIVRCAMNIHSKTIVPIFTVSNVTLEGIPQLHKFLNLTPKRIPPTLDTDVECHLDTSWTVPGVGTVIGGHLIQGIVKVGDKLWFGPNQNTYSLITVKSIQCKRVPLQTVSTSCYICLGVRGITKFDVQKGNVLVSTREQQILCDTVVADVEVLLSHSTTIRVGYHPLMHTLNVRTSVIIEEITHKVSSRDDTTDTDLILRTGDTARVRMRLNFGNKFIKVGSNILLCEGRTKVVGKIIA